MRPGTLIYAAVCVVALTYLVYANMRGYVPFTANAASASRGASTARHFHK